MPFSSPGYFGAVRTLDRIVGQNAGQGQLGNRVFLAGLNAGRNSTANDLVVIGSSALDAGLVATPALDGTQAIGTNAAGALIGAGNATGIAAAGPVMAHGYNALALAPYARGSVFLGNSVAANANALIGNPIEGCVFIGTDVGTSALSVAGVRHGDFTRSTVIGYQAGRLNPASPFQRGIDNSVVMGYQALGNYLATGVVNVGNSVIVGANAGRNYDPNGTNGGVVLIGNGAGENLTGGGTVLIGQAASGGVSTDDAVGIGTSVSVFGDRVVAIGAGAQQLGGATDTVLIGPGCQGGGLLSTYLGGGGHVLTGDRNIVVGYGGGAGETAANADRFIVETFTGGTRRGVLYGNLNAGNVIAGKSTPGVDRDLETINCTNALKLLNGTRGAGNPAGGGFFYVNAGALRYVGSAGTDTLLAAA